MPDWFSLPTLALAGCAAIGAWLRRPPVDMALAARLDAFGGAIQSGLRELASQQGELAARIGREGMELRLTLEARLADQAETQGRHLAAIRAAVDAELARVVERQMEHSFQRVVDQFAAVQKSMGDVQAVTAQIGDLKRLFGNVKTRGGWGETQLRALLDDMLPEGSYETNRKLRADSDDLVEFALVMPMRGEHRPYMAIDAKFPTEDYERLLQAAELGDADAERAARRALEARVKGEARKIAAKYIAPPATVEFAVLYLPTDGLYAEIARAPGLIDMIGREHKILVMGPTLLPALLRTIQLGFVTLALEQKADEVRQLLGATRAELLKMDGVLEKLGKQAGAFGNTVEEARRRTRVMNRKLRGVETLAPEQAAEVLALDWAEEGVE